MWWVNEINDYSETYYPILFGIQRNFRENLTISTWRGDIFGGMPLFGDPLSMLLNPINWLSLIIDLKWFFPLAVVISFFIGFIGMRKMLREFGIKRNISNLFSVVYMLLPMSIAHIKAGHLNIYEAVSFYPWVIYCFKRWVLKDTKRYPIYLAIASTLLLFSHPGMFYIIMFALVPVSLYFVFKKRIRIRSYVFFWFTLIGLSSIYILPTLELSQYINRSALTKADIVPIWTIKSILGGLFFPYPKINQIDQEAILYPGIIISLLAFNGFLRISKIKKIYVFLFLLILLIISLGSFTPVYYLLIKLLPFEGVFRVSSRFWYLALLLLVFLAAKGANQLKKGKLTYLVLILELAVFAFFRITLPGRYGEITKILQFDKYFNDSIYKFRIYSSTHSLSQRKIAEVNAGIADGEYPLQLKTYSDYLQKAGGYSYDQYSVIHPPYQIYQQKPQANAEILGKLNVFYVASPYELRDPNFYKAGEDQNLILYKNSQFKQYLWSEDREIKLLRYKDFGNKVEADFEADNEVRVNWGVRNYPGWRMKIDGVNIKLNPKNVWYEFKIGSGKHKLEAIFRNNYYLAGLFISLLSSLIVVIYLIKTNLKHF